MNEAVKKFLLITFLFFVFLPNGFGYTQTGGNQFWILPGGQNEAIYKELLEPVIARSSDARIEIRIVPLPLTKDLKTISELSLDNLRQEAQRHKTAIYEACLSILSQTQSCEVELLPIYTHADADRGDLVDQLLNKSIDAIVILEGNPARTLEAIKGTALEFGLGGAYAQGTALIGFAEEAGYQVVISPNNLNPFTFGAVSFPEEQEKAGFEYGFDSFIVSTQFHALNFFPFLLNTIALPGKPHLGIGIDRETAIVIKDNQLISQVLGNSTVTILDAETYHAADTAKYIGAENFISLRNVIVHYLSKGDVNYNINSLAFEGFSPVEGIDRQVDLRAPEQAGLLLISDNLMNTSKSTETLYQFINASGGNDAFILIIATGFMNETDAIEFTEKFAQIIPTKREVLISPSMDGITQEVLSPYTGIILTMGQHFTGDATPLQLLEQSWLKGKNIILDNHAALLAGEYFVDKVETQNPVNNVFLNTENHLTPGLKFIDSCIETKFDSGGFPSGLFALANHCASKTAVGMLPDSVLAIDAQGARNIGDNVIVFLDFNHVYKDTQKSSGVLIANGFLDVFAPGESIVLNNAEKDVDLLPYPTPNFPAYSPTPPLALESTIIPTTVLETTPAISTPSPTATIRQRTMRQLTHTPSPTSVSEDTYFSPLDPILKQVMIILGGVILLIIIAGLIINRNMLQRN